MTDAVSRSLVETFYRAYATRDARQVAEFLTDDVEWTISGPVDVLPFCGTRHGKAAVCDLIARLVPKTFRITGFVTNSMLVDGDQAATLNRVSGTHTDDGRMISYRLAHFMRFSDGKVVKKISLLDSFDAAEQMLGHPLSGEAVHAAPVGHQVGI